MRPLFSLRNNITAIIISAQFFYKNKLFVRMWLFDIKDFIRCATKWAGRWDIQFWYIIIYIMILNDSSEIVQVYFKR